MKSIIREIIAISVILASICLILVMLFFDDIKSESNQPQAAVYKMTDDEAKIMAEKEEYADSQSKIVLNSGYTVSAEELMQYKAEGNLKTGQVNPFDETSITDVIYDTDGNAYYQVLTSQSNASTNANQRFGTSLNTLTTNNVAGATGSQANTQNNLQQPATQNVQTSTITQNQALANPTQDNTAKQTVNQAYNPKADITAPSTDSGNLSLPTGKK